MPKKVKKAAISVKEDKIKELMDFSDDEEIFKMIICLDTGRVEIIRVPVRAIKSKFMTSVEDTKDEEDNDEGN